MSNPLEEYLSALEARDAREQAHAEYINAYTKLADRTAALSKAPSTDPAAPSPSASKSIPPKASRGKSSPAPEPSSLTQLRTELATTQKTRSSLESQVSELTISLTALQTTDTEQKKRIMQLEKVKELLERRVKDRADELKGKGRFVEEVQDEMVAMTLQLNVTEQECEKLRRENKELTRRWVERMEKEAEKVNEANKAWEGRRK